MHAPDEDGWQIEDFENAYRNWMLSSMHMERHGILLDLMADTPFEWSPRLPRDADRAADGRNLRERFAVETGEGILQSWLGEGWPCSFLEFAVALAYSITDNISYEPDLPDQASSIFWEMMENIGIDSFDDAKMVQGSMLAYMEVCEVLDRVMQRRYDYNGNGGLFPLRRPKMDQRDVEIWYQANAYMIEKEGL